MCQTFSCCHDAHEILLALYVLLTVCNGVIMFVTDFSQLIGNATGLT